jgi:hypothetical protein
MILKTLGEVQMASRPVLARFVQDRFEVLGYAIPIGLCVWIVETDLQPMVEEEGVYFNTFEDVLRWIDDLSTFGADVSELETWYTY